MNLELALTEAKRNYWDLVEKAGISIVIDDLEGNFAYFNEKFPVLFGYTSEEIKEKTISTLVHPEDVDFVMNMHKQRMAGKPVPSRYEFRGIKKDGSVIYLEVDVTQLKEGQNIIATHSYLWDITERKRAEKVNAVLHKISKSINESSDLDTLYPKIHQNLWEIIDATNFYIALYDNKRDTIRFVYFTDECDDEPEIKNASTSDSLTAGIINSKQSQLMSQEKLARKYASPRQEWGTQPQVWLGVPLIIKGEVIGAIALQSYTNPDLYSGKDIELLESISEHIAFAIQRKRAEEEKRRLEEQLHQTKKMEALGTLAGGIAHDFNNLLGAIMGYTELTLLSTPENDASRQELECIMAAAHRAKDMIHQILAFSQKDEEERTPIHIDSIVKEAVKLLKPILPDNIEIRQTIEAGSSMVLGSSTQLYQVIMNICTNAIQAMAGKGGTIDVRLSEVALDAGHQIGTQLKPGTYLCLSIADSGCGIEPEIIDRIFEPYFTTRKNQQGTGMGLAVVHGIVRKHEGDVSVASEPGKGTTIQVFLPLLPAERISLPEEKPAPPVRGGNERILLLDDEPSLADIGKQMLERLGYQVSSWTDGSQALTHFRNNCTRFDLVITDMTMPEMTGLQFSRQVKKIRPEIPVILCTGFSEAVNQDNFPDYGISALMMKPYLKKDIAVIIRDVLDG